MAYTRPDGDSADFEFTGAAYTQPDGAAADFSFEPPPVAGGAVLKVWLSGSWATKPLKYWTGSAWSSSGVLRYWDGAQWVPSATAVDSITTEAGENLLTEAGDTITQE